MRALLDTHAFLWWVLDDPRLSVSSRRFIEEPANEVLISAATGYEIALKSMIGRLVEAYADERGIDLCSHGSWTVKERGVERGAEADECYVLGTHEPDRPDLAIEVVWTSGGLDKLDAYRGLLVREVWFWTDGQLTVHELQGDGYVARAGSLLLPGLDLAEVARFATRTDQSQALREFRAGLRRDAP